MSTLTLQAAYQELSNNFAFYSNPANRQALLELVGRVDATNSTGAVTLAYSGPMNSGLHSTDVINTLKANDENVRLIDKTDAGKFLESREFRDVVAKSFGLEDSRALGEAPSTHEANKWLYNATEGPWALASEKFIGSATGEIWGLTNGADPTRVFGATELPAAMNNPNVTHINGIAKTDLLKFTPEEAFKAVAAQAEIKSSELRYTANPDGSAIKNADGTLKGLDASKFFEGTDVKLNVVSSNPDLKPLANYYTHQQLQQHAEGQKVLETIQKSYIEQANLLGSENQVARAAAIKALDKLGIAGDLLALALVATNANAAYAAGDTEAGDQIIQDWATDFVGGLAGGILAAKLVSAALAPLYLAGPAGAIIAGGLSLAVGVVGSIAGGQYLTDLVGKISDVFAAFGFNAATPPQAASNRVRDPLALDMDGDGIETTGLNGSTILFDHNADGVKTGTGWVQGDDAWLVRDLNGNGTIDTGRELFGEDTIKTNGQLAIDGFDALRDLDLNRDGLINAADGVFGQLRLWKDINQDGISQADELSDLTSNNIVSIGVNGALTNVNLGNGNVQTAAGTFVRSDGSAGATSETSSSIVNLDLIVNSFDREFTESIELSDLAIQLPSIRGAGMVRNLNEAVSLSPVLANTVLAYASQQTRAGQMDLLDALVEQWADSSDMKSLKQQAEALSGSGVSLVYQLAGLTQATAVYNEVVRKIGVVERFMGFTYGTANGAARFTDLTAADGAVTVSLVQTQIDSINTAYAQLKTEVYDGLLFSTRFKNYLDQISLVWVDGKFQISTAGLESAFTAETTAQPEIGLLNLFEFITASSSSLFDSLNWDANRFIKQLVESNPAITNVSSNLPSSLLRVLNETQTNLTTGNTSDVLIGNTLGNTLNGGAGDDLLIGEDGIDWLHGEAGNDTLYGGNQNDYLLSGDGNDLLDGGAGDDALEGGSGNDTFIFGRGYGRDHITSYAVLPSDFDVVQLNADLNPEDIVVSRSFTSLFLTIRGTTESLQIQDFFESNGAPSHRMDEVRFADGTVWTSNYLMQTVLQGSTGIDNLIGYATADVIYAGAGNDTLAGAAGSDTLYGEDGNDTIRGDDGADTLLGGNGDDRLEGGAGDDTLDGGAGNDTLIGGSGNDVLTGGMGNDTLDGGLGNDIYTFARGFGQDTISSSDSTVSKLDAVVFAQDILPSDVVFTRVANDLKLTVSGTSDALTVVSYFQLDGASPNRLEEIRFADGTVWSIGHIKATLLNGSSLSETIWGYATDDAIFGNAGDDILYGQNGDDVVDGDFGNDKLYGDNGNDLLRAGQGHDFMYGGSGNDVIDGGAGNDYLRGNNDSDTYVFGRGDGQDTIDNFDAGLNKLDSVLFKANVLPSDISISRANTNLVLTINGTTDSLTLLSYFDLDGTSHYKLEEIKFSNGTVWNIADVKAMVLQGTSQNQTLTGYASNDVINAGAGNDVLFGGSGSDLLYGEDGNDRLYGEDGNDVLDGGAGTDLLNGGAGNDTYLFGRGHGQDTIDVNDATVGKLDVVQLGAGVLTTDVDLKRVGNHLVLSIKGTTDTLQVNNYFYSETSTLYQVEQIKFADGTIWNTATVKAKVLIGSSSSDTLNGYMTNDLLQGNSGNDILSGGAGNDTLDGGAGNDMLDGGAGNDTYLFGRGYGQDAISAYDNVVGKLDFIQLNAGVLTTDVELKRVGNNLLLSIKGTTDTLEVMYHFQSETNNAYRVEQIKFADGTIWDLAAIKAKVLIGTSGNDTLNGYMTDDILQGNGGNDSLNGRAGNDDLVGGRGDDLLQGDVGNDTFVFSKGDGKDTIYVASQYGGQTNFTEKLVLNDMNSSDVHLYKQGTSLYVQQKESSTDHVHIVGHFNGGFSELDQLIFADGSIWDTATINGVVNGTIDPNALNVAQSQEYV